ncbi:MAG: 4Fe-4S dicluster domain-containing protein [Aquabacterium sp.]
MPRIIPILSAQTEAKRQDDGRAEEAGFDAARRRALKLMAAGLAMASGACTKLPAEPIQAYGGMPEHAPGDGARYMATAYVREGHAHGVLVATQDGRPIKVEGNPDHPSSLGATDIYAQASILELWDPDRSTSVMLRVPPTHTEEATESSPDKAVSSWADFEKAWSPWRASLSARQGRGLYIVTGPISSPTLRAQLASLLARMPQACWVGHDEAPTSAARAAGVMACGQAVQARWHLDRAQAVLCLDADPFHGGAGSVRHAMDWAAQRSAASPSSAGRPWLFAAETVPGLAGARADMRVALGAPEIEALLWRLADRLAPGLAQDHGPHTKEPRPSSLAQQAFEDTVFEGLRAAGPRALIISGESLSVQAQAMVHLIHHKLGCIGQTVDWIEPVLTQPPHTMADLAKDMRAGKVQALWLLDCNPVYATSASLNLKQAMAHVPFSVHLGLHEDESAQACAWHLPASHAYEQWSDARAFDGTVSIVQPAISPLYDTRSIHEVVALMTGDDTRHGHEIVRGFWRAHLKAQAKGQADFESTWRSALQQGFIADSASSPIATAGLAWAHTLARPAPLDTPPSQWLLQTVPDHAVRHGAFSNNGWLQELPRPFTSLTWGHALMLGPQSAKALKVGTGDVVRVRAVHGGEGVTCPVWVLPSHAEGTVTLSTGYGRWRAGAMGNGIGVNAHALRPLDGGVLSRVAIEKTGDQHAFAIRQVQMDDAGRHPARTMSPEEETRASRGGSQAPKPSLYPPQTDPVHAWAMTIDLDACIGCGACTVACQVENNIPTVGPQEVARGRSMHWIRVDNYDTPQGETLFQPVPCMHCENAPCEIVCPVGATMHDSEGLNAQVYNRCVGTRFCSNNCPYKVRRFNFLQYSDLTHESLKGMRNPDVTVRERGVMEKCTYCVQRISRARRHAEKTDEPVRDGDVVTACQAVCPTRAIVFGDLNDPESQVVRSRDSARHYVLLEELNTRPRTTYLARRTREPS